MAMILDGSNGVTFNDSSLQGAAASPYGLKNRIINGDMRIDQRNAGASVTIPTSNPTYSLDRWGGGATQNSKFTIQQNAGSVTPPAGFTKYLGVTSSSAYSVLSTDYFYITQRIEGFNFADLGFGTANAQTITISFWVRSSLTGTFGGAFVNENYDRAYPFTYTISSANTWEKKTITIAGDTTGTWNTTNNIGAVLFLGLGAGSSNSGTAGAWAASGCISATGATSVVGTNGATWYLTGVQLEVGSTATPFERRMYGQELALCHRYYYQETLGIFPYAFCSYTTNIGVAMGRFPQIMRATPTMSVSSGMAKNVPSSPYQNPLSSMTPDPVSYAFNIYGTLAAGISAGQSYACGFTFTSSAEL